jgi:flagellar biosynthesis protein FlhF
MKIKKYTGVSLSSIFAKVKSDLGEKAVILNTKKIKDGSFPGFPKIEVTAAVAPPVFEESVLPHKTLDEKTAMEFLRSLKEHMQSCSSVETVEIAPEEKTAAAKKDPPYDDMRHEIKEMRDILTTLCLGKQDVLDERLKTARDILRYSHVEDAVIFSILGRLGIPANSSLTDDLQRQMLLDAMREKIRVARVPAGALPDEVCILLGPTGVGKTTTLAKLASIAAIRNNAPVALITLDSFRAGACEQLQHYAKILDAPFHAVSRKEELLPLVEDLRKKYRIFIDSSGFSQYNKMKIRELNNLLRDIRGSQKLLLISAATHPGELSGILNNFCGIIDISGLIVTKLDETERPGQILSIGKHTDIPITYVTNGQTVPDNIRDADSTALARKILYGEL